MVIRWLFCYVCHKREVVRHCSSSRDFTLIDKHTGTIDDWRAAVDAVHARGMYILFDMTGKRLRYIVLPC